jgi:hypothetical protein
VVYARNGGTRGLPYLGVQTLLRRIDVSTAYRHARRASLQVVSEPSWSYSTHVACKKWENPCSEGWAGRRVEGSWQMSKLPLSSQSWKSCTSLCSSLQHSINPIKSPLFCLHNERHPRCPASNVIKDELGVLQNCLGTGGQKPNLRGETSGVMTYREQCEKAEHSAAGACTPCCCPYTRRNAGSINRCMLSLLCGCWMELSDGRHGKGPASPKSFFQLDLA